MLQLYLEPTSPSGTVVNIGEASDVNTLLRYMLGQRQPVTGEPVPGDQALGAAERLADRANRALAAGISSTEVRLSEAYFRTWDGS